MRIKTNNYEIPLDYESLSDFPMIGQYIGYTTMSIVNDEPYPMLDVNMVRFINRIFGEGKLKDYRYDKYIQNIAFRLVKHVNHKLINWAILDFGSLICKKRNPNCSICIFQSECIYFRNHIKTIENV